MEPRHSERPPQGSGWSGSRRDGLQQSPSRQRQGERTLTPRLPTSRARTLRTAAGREPTPSLHREVGRFSPTNETAPPVQKGDQARHDAGVTPDPSGCDGQSTSNESGSPVARLAAAYRASPTLAAPTSKQRVLNLAGSFVVLVFFTVETLLGASGHGSRWGLALFAWCSGVLWLAFTERFKDFRQSRRRPD